MREQHLNLPRIGDLKRAKNQALRCAFVNHAQDDTNPPPANPR
jgi:hypothetical protein